MRAARSHPCFPKNQGGRWRSRSRAATERARLLPRRMQGLPPQSASAHHGTHRHSTRVVCPAKLPRYLSLRLHFSPPKSDMASPRWAERRGTPKLRARAREIARCATSSPPPRQKRATGTPPLPLTSHGERATRGRFRAQILLSSAQWKQFVARFEERSRAR